MKLFQSLVRQVEEVRFRYVKWNASRSPKRSKSPLLCTTHRIVNTAARSPLIWGVIALSLTSASGYRFYNTPRLDIGKAATQTIYAPASVTIEDPKATEEKRKIARSGSIPMLQLDQSVSHQMQRQLQQQLQQCNEVRRQAGAFPYAKTLALSVAVQATIRRMPDAEWQSILVKVDPTPQNSLGLGSNFERSDAGNNDATFSTPDQRQRAIAELKAYRRSVNPSTYSRLMAEIAEARIGYVAATTTMPQPIVPQLPGSFSLAVLDLTDREWQQVQTKLPQTTELILTQGIPPGLPTPILQDAIKLHVDSSLPDRAKPLANELLAALLQPNLVPDAAETRLQAEQAAQQIEPELVSIRRGEKIVQQGQIISSANFALLEHFKLSRREVDWVGLISFGALVSGAIAIVWAVKRRFYPNLRRRDGVLLWLLSLSTPLLVALHLPSTNLPAVGLLIGSFYGAPMGITVTGLTATLLAVGMDANWSYLLSSAAAGLLCGWLGGRLRSREEVAVLGVGVGLLQGTLYLLLNVASGTVWYTLLGASATQAVIGLAWVIISMGSSPYLEHVFDLVTTIRLVELANPNRPLLKRLAATAPGTFQHTLFVATLAEAAARSLGCNVELVRAGTLYHDIGKMHDPLGFIENQMGGPNKHDLINNPWESAEIIKKHVSEGIVMARKARLPRAVQAFIPEHQGTMLIAYFFHQAQQQSSNGAAIGEADFRYDGPIPQSRETGIVMLADSCEAALRSLKDATPEEALAMINRIMRARWQDNQMSHCGLTRDNMTQIATVFVQVWQQSNHQRIAYPKLSPSPQPLKG